MLVAAVVACGTFGPGDLNRVISIEVSAPDSLEQYDTVTARGRVLDGHGDSVAAVTWALPDSADSVALTLLDSVTGRLVVNQPGLTGRLLAHGDGLVSNPVSIRTLAAATLLTAVGPVVDTVTLSADSSSDSLRVEVADTIQSASGGDSLTIPLAGRPVVYAITAPAVPGPVTLVTTDTARSLVTTDTVTTGASGIAFVKVRLLGPPVPDSVVVQAVARRATGDTVPGSPVTFVVRFQP